MGIDSVVEIFKMGDNSCGLKIAMFIFIHFSRQDNSIQLKSLIVIGFPSFFASIHKTQTSMNK